MGEILVGTAGWTDPTLLATDWYPPEARTAEDRLRYYASRFPLVEVDSTYYASPAENTARLWAERTPADFIFTVKAFSLLTHHPTKPSALPKDLRPEGSRNLYQRDADPGLVESVWERFLSALTPLLDAGKLGGLLFQFPQWFPIGRRNKQYLLECQRRCAPVPVCVEFRNHTWMSEDNQRETLGFLSDHALPYVCVDMPQGYPNSIPPVLAATADLAVVRFHGHSEKWTSRDVQERFGYHYSGPELAEWAPRITDLAQRADRTHVVMNNCHADYAHTNAQQLSHLLVGG
ncbi:DUF72 domain-containing protein [Actinoalloteichus caeruleus]|uniref:DUF72 domain-containing protein n=1 Tax=Actinoalloteichus cyanogriseus TaxID=2893586 RepID=UPI003BB8B605